MTRRSRQRASARLLGFGLVEAAVGFALVGSVLAIAVPTFVRELHASRFVEPTQGLATLAAEAVRYASGRSTAAAFPTSVALAPSVPPRGKLVADPPGTWSDPTWRALAFPSERFDFAVGVPHAFAFGFDSTLSATRSAFVAHAHADLDGDGALSTFEVHGHAAGTGVGEAALVEPGMYVEAALE